MTSAGGTVSTRFGDRRMLIGGQLVEGVDGRWIGSIDPATEELLGRVPNGSAFDVEHAVAEASDAWPAWARLPAETRGDYLRELALAIEGRSDELVEMEVRDTGITVGKIRGDIASACRMLRYFAGLGLEVKGQTIPSARSAWHLTLREPFGVVGRIIPFNHPLQFAASRIAAPLMAGNSVVIKPPEQSPLTATVLSEICADLFPPGVVNIVTGGPVVGEALVRHPLVRRLALIGSPRTGMAIQRAAAEVAVKSVTLELGGKNPSIVFPDVPVDAVVIGALGGMKLGHQGQSCGSITRLFVHRTAYDQVVHAVGAGVDACRVGNPLDPEVDMGPMNSRAQYEKTMGHIEAALEDGARLVAGGARPSGTEYDKGFWVRPTVFADVTPNMRIFKEEVFGPVLSVIPWTDVDEVLSMANDSEYGLTAAVWTGDIDVALSTARRVKAGYVSINAVPKHYPGVPFGGTKDSGLGAEEGLQELLSYTTVKTVNVLVS